MHVGTTQEQCIANNERRIRRREAREKGEIDTETETGPDAHPDDEEPYPRELLENLIFRYEEPSTAGRWDKPLFTIPWTDAEPPIADIWTALTGLPHPSSTDTPAEPPVSELGASLASTQISDTASIATFRTGATRTTTAAGGGRLGRPKIKPHQSTMLPAATGTNALYAFEKSTQAIISIIRTFTQSTPTAEAALAQSPDAAGISITVPEASTPIFIPAHVATTGTTDELAGAGGILALPRLQRLRRQWIGLNRAHAAGKGSLPPEQVPDAFVRFLNADFAGDDEA